MADYYTFSNNNTVKSSALQNIRIGPNKETLITDNVIAQGGLRIGNTTSGYSFPLNSTTTDGYTLTSGVGGNLKWARSGDIFNGGNDTGPILIKTKDPTDVSIVAGSKLNLNSLGEINIGSIGNTNQIFLHGSVGYQYNNIKTALGTLNLNADYYFVDVTNSGTHTIQLPACSASTGRHYIISKGFNTGKLTILTDNADTIDGTDKKIELSIDGQKIQIISNGFDKWVIL